MSAAVESAVILAAGLGTRLRPLTYQVPKPLFPILNRPLLGLLLAQLAAAGFRRVAVNTHHHGQAVADFLKSRAPDRLEILVRHEPEILGTGGGLKNLVDFIGAEPFLVINSDIVTDIELTALTAAHAPDTLATMLLHDYPRFNTVWLDGAGYVQGFGTPPSGVLARPLAFTGIQVVSARLLELMPPGEFVNIIDTYRQAIAAGGKIAGFVQQDFFWQDIGTPQDYLDLHSRLLRGAVPGLQRFFPHPTDPWLGPGVQLGNNIHFGPGVCLGARVQVGNGARLENTVVWSGAVIEAGVSLKNCLVAQNTRVQESACGRCLIP